MRIIPFLGKKMEEWQLNGTRDRPEHLRECAEHLDLLFHFARCFKKANHFAKPISAYMGATCEAFTILDYANNYNCWLLECDRIEQLAGGTSRQSAKYTVL